MKIELSHDALARRIYSRSSAEDKMRLKISDFIKQRYRYYEDSGKRALLNRNDFNYIEPYLSQIILLPEEGLFIKKSRGAIKRRLLMMIIFIIAAIIGLFIYSQVMRVYKERAELLGNNLALKIDTVENQKKQLAQVISAKDSISGAINNIAIKLGLRGANQESIFRAVNKHLEAMAEADSISKVRELEVGRYKAIINSREVQLTRLQERTSTLEKERDKYKKDVDALNEEIKRLKAGGGSTTTTIGTRSKESVSLASYAQSFLKKREYEKAFQLAAAAYNRDPKNEEALDILRAVHKAQSGEISALSTPAKNIISKYATDAKYGKLWTENELRAYLK